MRKLWEFCGNGCNLRRTLCVCVCVCVLQTLTWTPRIPNMMKKAQQMTTMLPMGFSDDMRVSTTSFRPGALLMTLEHNTRVTPRELWVFAWPCTHAGTQQMETPAATHPQVITHHPVCTHHAQIFLFGCSFCLTITFTTFRFDFWTLWQPIFRRPCRRESTAFSPLLIWS